MDMLANSLSYLRAFRNFLGGLLKRRSLIFEMAKRDIITQYVGSMLGFFWTFINPLIMIFIFWLVFDVGLKAAPLGLGNVPFLLYLTTGMAIWLTFSEVMTGATSALIQNAFLVKKVVFPLSILPVVKLVSSFITHTIFLLILILMLLIYHLPFSFYWFQALYYFFAMSVLVLGISWFTSSVNIFFKDTMQIVNVLLQFGFWGTPIVWDIGIMPEKVQYILKFNPLYYIVQGYRDSFIYFVPFWEHWQMTLYYWGITGVVFCFGSIVFRRLRPHFADVL
jgi:ABC-type polysaccharide/polyol phosphate export permease